MMKAIILWVNDSLALWLQGRLQETEIGEAARFDRLIPAAEALTGEEEYLFFLPSGSPGIPDRLTDIMSASKAAWEWVLVLEKPDAAAVRRAMNQQAVSVITRQDTREEVIDSLRTAVRALRKRRETKLILDAFHQQHYAMIGQGMRGLLTHARNELDLVYLEKLGLIPHLDQLGWLVLIHVTNRRENTDTPRTVISMYTSKTAETLFLSLDELQAVTWMQNDIMALFLQNRSGIEPEWQQIREQLDILRKELETRYGWQTSMYAAGPLLIRDTPGKWPELELCMRNNVVMSTGVYHYDEMKPDSRNYQHLQMYDLWRMLNQGNFEIAETEVIEQLQRMKAAGEMNRAALQGFYLQFIQVIYAFMWEKGWKAEMLFGSEEDTELQNRAIRNISGMVELIRHVTGFFRSQFVYSTPESVTQTVCRYINDHMQEPLRRDELAAYVHLNPDYLSRIFRRHLGMSIKDYVAMTRLEAARRLLRGSRMRISEIAEAVGYGNYSYFTHNYHERFGITPLQERNSDKEKQSLEEKK